MQTIPTVTPHSGLGIASFVISLAAGVTMFLSVSIAGIADAEQGGLDLGSPMASVLGIFILCSAIAQIVALGLGIAGLVQADRNRLFGALGTVLSALALLAGLALTLLGAAMEG
jgi:hypothetical protein